jgi:hypothetical protein
MSVKDGYYNAPAIDSNYESIVSVVNGKGEFMWVKYDESPRGVWCKFTLGPEWLEWLELKSVVWSSYKPIEKHEAFIKIL